MEAGGKPGYAAQVDSRRECGSMEIGFVVVVVQGVCRACALGTLSLLEDGGARRLSHADGPTLGDVGEFSVRV